MKTYRIKAYVLALLSISLLGLGINSNAEVLVIGNKSSAIANLSAKQVKALFLGKSLKLPDGQKATVVDLPVGNPLRNEFYTKLIHKNSSQIKAYWAKRIFTGRGTPPKSLSSQNAVVDWVSGGPGRIGYVDSSALNDKVTVLLRQP